MIVHHLGDKVGIAKPDVFFIPSGRLASQDNGEETGTSNSILLCLKGIRFYHEGDRFVGFNYSDRCSSVLLTHQICGSEETSTPHLFLLPVSGRASATLNIQINHNCLKH